MKKYITLLLVFLMVTLSSCTKIPVSSDTGSSSENSMTVDDSSADSDTNEIKITQIAINREIIYTDQDEISYSDTDYFYYNLLDPTMDTIAVDVKTNCSDADVTTSGWDSFQIGENDVTITVTAPGKNPITVKVKVCRYDKDGFNAYWTYQKAIDFYWLNIPDFKYDKKDVYTTAGGNPAVAVLNYNEVMGQNFTKKGIKQFEETNQSWYFKHEGKMYLSEPGLMTEKNTYIYTILIRKSLTADTAIYTAKTLSSDGHSTIIVKNFILKKQNGNWLIDDFTSPY